MHATATEKESIAVLVARKGNVEFVATYYLHCHFLKLTSYFLYAE